MGSWAFGQSDTEIRDIILHFVGTAMGVPSLIPGHGHGTGGHGDSASPRCMSVSVTRWEEDDYTRGSYTEYKLGTTNGDVDNIKSAAYDGRLLFAGEHTEPEHMGSVHGALMSGTRIAHEVMKSLMTSSK
jgi:monoamine oxidase